MHLKYIIPTCIANEVFFRGNWNNDYEQRSNVILLSDIGIITILVKHVAYM